MRKKVLVAMSGGVDSSVAAHLLKEKGFEVAGLTMCFGIKESDKEKPACCGHQAREDAKKVCHKLEIPHYVIDFSKHLEKEVINKFVSEYRKGRTPNPCVDCNRSLKFDILLKKALSLGFDYLATGHYAKIVTAKPQKIVKNAKGYILKKARDRKKDQSYFLYSVKKNALKSVLFPLGGLTKNEVRNIARKIKLPVADKPGSQDICFIPGKDRYGFLSQRIKRRKCGRILDLDGGVLGKHKGAFFYTIGQRKGLGIGYKHPLYVLAINTEENQLVVGGREDLRSEGLVAGELNFLVRNLPKKVFAKIRYNHKEAKCKISPAREKIRVIFEKAQEAITPGQSIVFYDKDTVFGGGVIEEVIRSS